MAYFEDRDAIDMNLPVEAIIEFSGYLDDFEPQAKTFRRLFEHSNDEKYIVGLVSPVSDDHKDYVQERYVLVSLKKKYHMDIATAYEQRLGEEAELTVMGGGILTINTQAKTIRTYGTSGGYGDPDIKLVARILEKAYPDYTRTVTVTNYIRG